MESTWQASFILHGHSFISLYPHEFGYHYGQDYDTVVNFGLWTVTIFIGGI